MQTIDLEAWREAEQLRDETIFPVVDLYGLVLAEGRERARLVAARAMRDNTSLYRAKLALAEEAAAEPAVAS